MSLEDWVTIHPIPVCQAAQGQYKDSFKKLIPLMLQWISTLPLPANGAISMLSYDFFMGPLVAAVILPGMIFDPIPVFPQAPVGVAAAAAPLALQIYKDGMALSSAYTNNTKIVKAVMIREFGTLLTHLEQGDSGLSRRTEMEIFGAAFAMLGTLTSSDHRHLRDRTLDPLGEGQLVTAEIKSLIGKHAKLATIGPDYCAGPQDKLHEATKLISESNPKAKSLVDLYLVETVIAARTFDGLTTYVVERLERLAEPEYVTSRALGFAPNHTAAAASTTAQAPTASTAGQAMSHAELLSFYEAAPVGKYCFVHGYCNHFGKTCPAMVNRQTKVLIAPYTVQHQTATKPAKISGLDGSTKTFLGFKIPL